jgi:hypothetical protein
MKFNENLFTVLKLLHADGQTDKHSKASMYIYTTFGWNWRNRTNIAVPALYF